MCGIVGLSSKVEVASTVLSASLKHLEYRGYDSCGIAYVKDGDIKLLKTIGKIANLEQIMPLDKINCGIAHTRWATHGAATQINAHPHQQNIVTLVHNGIIENADRLRKKLKDHKFLSDTDTEVIAALIDKNYQKCKNKQQAIFDACKMMEGSYALAIMFKDELDAIYCIRKNNPLLFGIKDNMVYLASDVSAFIEHTNQVVYLDENILGYLKAGKLSLFDQDANEVDIVVEHSQVVFDDVSKGEFDTFLLKEIYEQPKVIQTTLNYYFQHDLNELEASLYDISKYQEIIFVGCGSAYHAGLIGQKMIERYAHKMTRAYLASEFRYADIILHPNSLVIFISQSGETADTLAALRKCNKMKVDTMAIVNVMDSAIYKEAKYPLLTLANKEISVATTKAYSAQVLVLILLVIRCMKMYDKKILQQLNSLANNVAQFIQNVDHEKIANIIKDQEHIYFLGRLLDHAICMEASLKLKEISYIHSEAYASGELKHGTIALIDENSVVIANIDELRIADKTLSNLSEVKARNCQVIIVSSLNDIDADIKVTKVHELLQPLVSITFYQLLAYSVAKLRGCNIDQPRNLAKSVTVE